VPAPSDTIPDTGLIARADAGRILGRDSSAMWVIVISDFQCPYCKQWHDSTFAAMKRDYVDRGRIRLAYLNLPLQQHPQAMAEAEAGLCAGVQGKFWQYADGLFHEQAAIGRLSDPAPLLDSLGRALKLDMKEFATCRRSRSIHALVQSDIQQATGAGVRSTPSFLVGDFLVQGVSPYADFRRAIDTALIVAKAKRKR
jgi:protein-disulfide isomerase